ncbi:MAG: hypothetical protein ACTJLK_02940 [Anaplasma sp.]
MCSSHVQDNIPLVTSLKRGNIDYLDNVAYCCGWFLWISRAAMTRGCCGASVRDGGRVAGVVVGQDVHAQGGRDAAPAPTESSDGAAGGNSAQSSPTGKAAAKAGDNVRKCCGGASSDGEQQSRGRVLLSYIGQSILCGISGASSFLIASSSALQSHIFLSVYGKHLEPSAYEMHKARMRVARCAVRDSLLPAAEMFILIPIVCTLVHLYANVEALPCVLICWGAMFAVCLSVRIAGVLKGCPSVGSPMYEDAFPFPKMVPARDGQQKPEPQMSASVLERGNSSSASMFKAVVLAIMFIPCRAITLFATTVLIAVDLAHLPFRFIRDFFCSALGVHSLDKGKGTFPQTAKTAESIGSYMKAALTDISWIASIGATGVPSLLYAASVSRVSFPQSGADRSGVPI